MVLWYRKNENSNSPALELKLTEYYDLTDKEFKIAEEIQ